jgi:hypothetical protein
MNSEHRDLIQVACASALLMLLVMLIMLGIHAAFGADNGQIPPNVPDNVRAWFKAVKSPSGVPCCDIADGHRTDYEIRGDGYWVPLGGEMRHVPPEAVIKNAGNPVGEAIVWYRDYGEAVNDPDRWYIRCFVPGGGV